MGPFDAGDGVQVWSIPLEQASERESELGCLLSDDEQRRAERFAFPHLRRRFTICRGTLRLLLAPLVDRPARRIRFTYGPHGKPALDADTDVSFNVSHAGERALVAIGRGRPIGVDIERIAPLTDLALLAGTVCSPAEQETLATLGSADRIIAFFNVWTRKEAFIKALGVGLAQRLADVDVSLVPGEPARLLRHEGDAAAPARWHLQALDLHQGYAAAVCYDGGQRDRGAAHPTYH